MKNILIYTLFALSFLASQDTRSTIFSTGTPETEEGYLISGDTSVADRFSVGIDYAMEAFRVTLAMESIFATVSVSIHEDSNNEPGEILGTWDIDLSTTAPREYLIYTFDDCITFEAGHNYWISVRSEDSTSVSRWIYSPLDQYTYSSSTDAQATWDTSIGFAGSAKVYAEAFYEPDPLHGDVNLDNQLNVLDVVTMVAYVTGNADLSDEQINLGDVNLDHEIDVLDIVQLINTIINENAMPSFSLLDFNPNSEYNGQYIGPETFTGEVSCYYFGKQG